MSDSSVDVKDTAVWTLGRICEQHPSILKSNVCIKISPPSYIMMQVDLSPLFNALLPALISGPAHVASHAAWCLCNLATAFEDVEKTSPLSVMFKDTVNVCYTYCIHTS